MIKKKSFKGNGKGNGNSKGKRNRNRNRNHKRNRGVKSASIGGMFLYVFEIILDLITKNITKPHF